MRTCGLKSDIFGWRLLLPNLAIRAICVRARDGLHHTKSTCRLAFLRKDNICPWDELSLCRPAFEPENAIESLKKYSIVWPGSFSGGDETTVYLRTATGVYPIG